MTFKRLLFLGLILTSPAWAKVGSLVRTLPGGFIFPSLSESTWLNSSVLVGKNRKIFGAKYSPPAPGTDVHQYRTTIAREGTDWGLGLTAEDFDVQGLESPTWSLGFGVKLPSLSFGIALRDDNPVDGNLPDSAFGLYSFFKKTYYGLIFRNQENRGELDFGVGFTDDSHYTLEFNLAIPTFLQSDNQPDYLASVSATVYESFVGFGIKSDYNINSNSNSHTLSGVLSLGEGVQAIARFELPTHRYSAELLLTW